MKRSALWILFWLGNSTCNWAQVFVNPISQFHKDEYFRYFQPSSTVLPHIAGTHNLDSYIRDSSKQYYGLTQKLFKEYLFQKAEDEYAIRFTPLLDLSLGKDHGDTTARRLFQNTRGLRAEVLLFDKLLLTGAFYENQARFSNYESNYYRQLGEKYPEDTLYITQNAVIPGAARTKPFKEDGYDFAYSVGSVVYRVNPNWTLSGGNDALFIGAGYRSLFLSDNSVPSTYLRSDLKIKKWNYTLLRAKHFNLLRRPFRTTVEAYYEPKLYSMHYVEWAPFNALKVGFFEAAHWSVGDSVSSHPVSTAYYIPIPILPGMVEDNPQSRHILRGVDAHFQWKKWMIYTQYTFQEWRMDQPAYQLGFRFAPQRKKLKAIIQAEFNHLPRTVYRHPQERLSYSGYHLPLAHPKGAGFDEFVLRTGIQYQRWYFDYKWVGYQLSDFRTLDLIVDYSPVKALNAQVHHHQMEWGYRFNPLLNFKTFLRYTYRSTTEPNLPFARIISFGIQTQLRNQYTDF